MRHDRLYLLDMVEACDAIAEFVGGCGEDDFVRNDLLRSAVLHKLTVIGEAAARVSRSLREQHPEVPWTSIAAFRNIAVHAYFAVDWKIVWNTAREDIPALKQLLAGVLQSESSG